MDNEKNITKQMDNSFKSTTVNIPAAVLHAEIHAFAQWMETRGVHSYLREIDEWPQTSDEEIDNLQRSQAGYFDKDDFWDDSQNNQ